MVADDSVLLREGLQLLLAEAGHEVVAAVGDGPTLVEAARSHRPELCIVDVRMPPSHTDEGLRAVVELRGEWPEARVMVLSQYVELSYAEDLLADGNGGIGYLLKDKVSDIEEFVDSLERVAGGGTVIDPIVVSQLLARHRDPMVALTPREREVLSLMAEGHSNAGIARAMTITEGAVEKYSARLFATRACSPTRRGTAGSAPYWRGSSSEADHAVQVSPAGRGNQRLSADASAHNVQYWPTTPPGSCPAALASLAPYRSQTAWAGQSGPMPTPTTVVLFGATGDLAQRKLLPGLLHLFESGLLTDLQVVGTSLDEHTRDSFVEFTRKAVAEYGGAGA